MSPSKFPLYALLQAGKPGWAVALLIATGGAGLGISQIVSSCTSGSAEMITAWRQPDAAKEVRELRTEVGEAKAKLDTAVSEAQRHAESAKASEAQVETLVSDAASRVEKGLKEERARMTVIEERLKYHSSILCWHNGGLAPNESMKCDAVELKPNPAEGYDPRRKFRTDSVYP